MGQTSCWRPPEHDEIRFYETQRETRCGWTHKRAVEYTTNSRVWNTYAIQKVYPSYRNQTGAPCVADECPLSRHVLWLYINSCAFIAMWKFSTKRFVYVRFQLKVLLYSSWSVSLVFLSNYLPNLRYGLRKTTRSVPVYSRNTKPCFKKNVMVTVNSWQFLQCVRPRNRSYHTSRLFLKMYLHNTLLITQYEST